MIKTNNYFNKREGEISSAVGLVQVDTKLGKATLYIGKNRDLILSGNYYEKQTLSVEFDRTKNPYEQAYEKFKSLIVEKYVDDVVVKEYPFKDWFDDLGE